MLSCTTWKKTHQSVPRRQRIVPFGELYLYLAQNFPREYLNRMLIRDFETCECTLISLPIIMARRIHTAKKRSSQPSPLNADTLSGAISFSICCLSISSGTIEGGAVDISSSGDAALEWKVFLGHFIISSDKLMSSLEMFYSYLAQKLSSFRAPRWSGIFVRCMAKELFCDDMAI